MLTCPNCGRESPEDFAFCPACSTPLSPVAPDREVRKTVSIVFCDVTGSTALGEQLDPESMRDVQSRYFDTMRAAIERHGGTVEKYIGDAVMAVFGIPVLHEDDALRAARAAADMRDALATLNKELERDRGVTIQVRIGVNTGEVVAGDPGGGNAFVTGDAVNVAARLEQHAEPGQVLLGETTYRLLRDAVDADAVEPLDVKGKADPVPAWSLVGVREVTSAVPRRLDSPMVGRERPLAQLRQAFDAAEGDDACQLFTLLGSAGVGKSRLVEEFLSTVGAAEVLRGRCLPYGEGITYFPVVEAIKQAAGLADFDLPDVVESKVCSVLDGDEHQELVCRHVSQLMGVDETAAGEDTFWAIRRFFEASARERPLVLVFDDVHWGEATFLDLVEHIADWSRGSPILLLCMARSDLLDVRPSWGGGKLNAATVSLEPLTDNQSADLIANLLGTAELPAGIAERIVRTAEGNPLFVEEMLAMLVDDDLIVRDDDRWIAAGDLSTVTVPASIHALLDSRLDRLSPEEREVLEAAAVIGKEFFVGAVRDLVPEDHRARVPSDLLSLVRKELIRSERTTLPGEDAFRFRHLLVRDSAYEAIPKAQRAEMHERFADWLERVAGAAVAEQEEILAYHLEQAHEYRLQLGPADERSDAVGARAAERLASAGRRASARGDHGAAANLFRRAVDLVPSGGARRARLLYELGGSAGWVGDTNEAFAAYDEAVRLTADATDRSLEWLARIRRSATQMLTEPHAKPTEQFRAELEQARRAFEELGDDAALATVWTELANIEWMPCRFYRATLAADRAIEYARRSGDERLLGEALVPLIGGQMLGLATPQEGMRTLDELRDDLSGSRLHESLGLSVRGAYLAMQGSFEEARRLVGLARDVAESVGAGFLLAANAEQLGQIERYADDAEAAERAYRYDYESLEGLGDEGHGSTGAAMLARVLCDVGRFEEAEGYAEIALRTGAPDDLATQVPARSTQALVRASRGEFAAAEQLAREAAELYADAECPNSQGDAWLDLAEVLRMADKPAEAKHVASEALAFYERKGNVPASRSARAFIDDLSGS